MLEMPEAWPTWSADTAAVEPDDAGPLARPRPTDERDQREHERAYSHDASTNASAANPTAARPNPSATARAAAEPGGERGDRRRDHDHAGGRGQRREARLERAHAERRRILEVQAEHVHQPVDRPGDDQDRQRRPDEHAVAQQLEVDERRPRAPLDPDEEEARDDRDGEAAERGGRRPAPVVALAEREDDRREHERDQHGAGPVDRARRFGSLDSCDGAQRQRDARRRDRRVDPEQPLPAGGVDEHAAEQRAERRRRRPTPRPTA